MKVTTALRSSAGRVLRTADTRRLKLAGLSPTDRRLTKAGIAASVVAATLLVVTPLGIALPMGSVLLQRTDAPRIGNLELAAFLIAIALASSMLVLAAAARSPRASRLTIASTGLLGLLVTPSVLDIDGVTPPILAAGLLCLVAVGLLIVVAVLGRPRKPPLVAALAAIPPLGALLTYLLAALPPASSGLQSEVATSVLNGALIAQAPLVALAAWAVIEYGRGLAAGMRPIARSAPSAWVPLAALALKLVLLGLALAGLFGAGLTGITPELVTAPLRESVLTIAWAASITVAIGWWLVRGRRTAALGRSATHGTWLVVLLLIIGYGLPLAAFGAGLLPERLGFASSGADMLRWMETVDTVQALALSLTPVIVASAALLGGAFLLFRGGQSRRGMAWLLLAYAAWAFIPGLSFALTERGVVKLTDTNDGPLGFIHPVTLDLFVTVLVAVLMAGWYLRLQRRVSPMTLVAILALSTAVAYAGSLVASEIGALLFWLGFAFPLAAQFLFDAEALNHTTDDRPARVLGAVGLSTLSLSMALPLVALGFASPESSGTDAFVKALVLVPLVAVLGVSAVSALAPAKEQLAEPVEPERARKLSPLTAAIAGTGAAGVLLAMLVVATLGTAGTLLALQEEPSPTPDPAIESGNGFTVRIPPEYAMDHTDTGFDQWTSADGNRLLLVFAYVLTDDELADPLEAATDTLNRRLDAAGSSVVGRLVPLSIPGAQALSGMASGDLAAEFTVMTATAGQTAWDIIVIGFDPDVEQQTLASFRFGP